MIGTFEPGADGRLECTIDDQRLLLIVHPDHLVTGTLAADSVGCVRRSVLNERMKGTADASSVLVFGSMVRPPPPRPVFPGCTDVPVRAGYGHCHTG